MEQQTQTSATGQAPDGAATSIPRAVIFDAYGTLFDVYSIGALAGELFPGYGERLALLWRDKQIEYTRLVTMSGEPGQHYRPFWELTRAGLRYATLRLGLTLDAGGEARLMDQYRQLAPFADSREVLTQLRARGVPTGILSNGDRAMLDAAVQSAGLGDLLTHVLSVDALRRYKTDDAAYALGPQAFGLAASEILFVSSNSWDALGATWFGYTTLWINRAGLPFEQLGTQPTHVAATLSELLALFDR